MKNNFIDCITHGTTKEDFLEQFSNAHEAASHLRNFYENQLEEYGLKSEFDLDEAEKETERLLKS